MKRKGTILRSLSTIGLLLFFLPFFQTCSNDVIRSDFGLEKTIRETQTDEQKEKSFEESRRNYTLSGYDLALDFGFSALFVFTIIMFLNFIIWVFALRNFSIEVLSVINAFIMFVSLIILLIVMPFGQFRYGIFLFQINSILLAYYSNKEYSEP